mgnify:CR=1 FL=1
MHVIKYCAKNLSFQCLQIPFWWFLNFNSSYRLTELSSIALAHLSQYFSIIIAPSVLYLTILVASSPHPIQTLEFFFASDVNGSMLFSVFSNNYIFANYIERRYIINHINQLSVSTPRLLRFKPNGIRTH